LDYGDFDRAEGTAFFSGWIPRRFTAILLPLKATAQQASGSDREITLVSSPAEEHADFVIPTYIDVKINF
jgi:hypothetical protein